MPVFFLHILALPAENKGHTWFLTHPCLPDDSPYFPKLRFQVFSSIYSWWTRMMCKCRAHSRLLIRYQVMEISEETWKWQSTLQVKLRFLKLSCFHLNLFGGAPGWLSCYASAFRLGRDPGVLESSPTWGSSTGSLLLPLPLSCLCSLSHWLSLCQINK